MGFSVSASFALLFVGLFIAFSGAYAVSENTFERVQNANEDQRQRMDTVQRTAVNVTRADRLDSCGVDLNVTNEGSTELSVNATDILVDGEYQTNWSDDATVEGVDTDVWLSGENLSVTIDDGITSDPSRVKVVSETGVATTAFPTGDTLC